MSVAELIRQQQALAAGLYGSGLTALQALRRRSLSALEQHGLPTARHEDWHYSDLSLLRTTAWRTGSGTLLADERERDLLGYLLAPLGAQRKVFVNGAFAPQLSQDTHSAWFRTLAAAAATHGALLATHLGTAFDAAAHPLAAWNTAMHADGALVHVPAGMHQHDPVHLAFLSTAEDAAIATHPRTLIVLEPGAQASLTISWQGSGRTHVNAVTEVLLGAGAKLELQLLQEDSALGLHTSLVALRLAQGAHCGLHAASLGAASARLEVAAELAGDDASLRLTGLIIGGQHQTHDLTTLVRHAALRTVSEQRVKAVLAERATGAFTGRVCVAPGAQKTDAAQSCRSLLLSPDASMNARPQLEIDADDVKCSHGATNGQLDPEALFYLRSRGIPLAEARILLTRAFADEVIDRFPVEGVRTHLHGRVDGRIARRETPGVEA